MNVHDTSTARAARTIHPCDDLMTAMSMLRGAYELLSDRVNLSGTTAGDIAVIVCAALERIEPVADYLEPMDVPVGYAIVRDATTRNRSA